MATRFQFFKTEVFGIRTFVLSKLFLFAVTLASVYQYRPQSNNEIRDLGVWVKAGDLIFQHRNPYVETQGLFKSGSISAILIKLTGQIFGSNIYFLLIITFALNILGVILFLRAIGLQNQQELYFFAGFIILCSPFREILVNGQLTGIVYGGLSILILRFNNLRKVNMVELFAYSLLVVFLVDLKPNLTLIPLLIIFWYFKQYLLALVSFCLFMLGHFSINFYVGAFLEKSWFDTLSSLNSFDLNPTLFGSISVWQVLNQVVLDPKLAIVLNYLPTLSFFVMSCFAIQFLFKRNFISAFSLAVLSSFVLSYVHFYSYLPIVVMLLLILMKNSEWYEFGVFASFFFLSFEVRANIIFSLLGLLIVLLCLVDSSMTRKSVFQISVGWVFSVLIRLPVKDLLDNELLAKSLLASIPFLWLLVKISKGSHYLYFRIDSRTDEQR